MLQPRAFLLVLPEPPPLELLGARRLDPPPEDLAQALSKRRPPRPEDAERRVKHLRLKDLEVEHGLVPRRDDDTWTAVARRLDHAARERGGGQQREEPEAGLLRRQTFFMS